MNSGYPGRFDLPLKMTRVETVGCHNSLTSAACYISKGDQTSYDLLIGDSHAGHFTHFLKDIAKKSDLTIKDASAGSCKFYTSQFISQRCDVVNQKIDQELTGAKRVFIANRFETLVDDKNFEQEYSSYVTDLVSKGHTVYIFLQVPKFLELDPLKKYSYSVRYGLNFDIDSRVDKEYKRANDVIKKLFTKAKGVHIVDFYDVICPNGICSQYKNDNLIYLDDDHLSAFGSSWLATQNTISLEKSGFKL